MNSVNQSPEHPANEELAAFALGKETANAETIAEHIANCTRCETLVANTPRDTFLGILNKAKPISGLTGAYVPKSIAPSADELPEELQRQTKYTFLKKLGGGGMGVVYLAEHNLMKRKVAIKLIPPEMIGNASVRERFLQEVVSAAALEHPNVVRAYSTEEFGPHMLFEMEYVDGLDLGAVLKRKGPLPVVFAVNYVRQAAQALQHGMLKSLVHRDIKPGNLMLTRAGGVKVADFGLAKFSRESDKGRERSLTGMNAMMGTPDYMAPEQARNAKTADIRADIYSLGCTFYFLLTGEPPFAGESVADLLFKHWEDPRPDVRKLRTDVPPELSQFIKTMMAKEPSDRPQTPKEVVDWLTKFVKGETTKKETVENLAADVGADDTKQTTESLDFENFTLEAAEFQTAAEAIGTKSVSRRSRSPSRGGYWRLALLALLGLSLAITAAWTGGVFTVNKKHDTFVLKNEPSAEPPRKTAIPADPPPRDEIKPPRQPQVGDEIKNMIGMRLMYIPPGTFTMGSPASEQAIAAKAHYGGREPQHKVRITKGFYMGKFEVTEGEYEQVMSKTQNSVARANGRLPASGIRWLDARDFCLKLSERTGENYTLPTEAEWEYACRAQTETAFCFGPTMSTEKANFDGTIRFGNNPIGINRNGLMPVGSFSANVFGLHDTHGNVGELCEDRFDFNYYNVSPTDDPKGPATGVQVVTRGGSWLNPGYNCRCASRLGIRPDINFSDSGFRVVLRK